jgi:hypothetical protein
VSRLKLHSFDSTAMDNRGVFENAQIIPQNNSTEQSAGCRFAYAEAAI